MFCEIRKRLQFEIDEGASFDAAVSMVENSILSTEKMTRDVVREAILIASRYVSRKAVSTQRMRIFNSAEKIASDRAAGTENLKQRVANLMAFRLPGGKQISEATGKECAEAAYFYRSLARTHYVRANWLESIAAAAGDKLVSMCMSESDLQSIYESMEKL